MNMSAACAANTERSIVNQAEYDEMYAIAKRDYLRMEDFSDIADHNPEQLPLMLVLIKRGLLLSAQLLLKEMTEKAADNHADIVATRHMDRWK